MGLPHGSLHAIICPTFDASAETLKRIVYTNHARAQMESRKVSESEVEATIRDPEMTRIGKRGAVRAFRTFPFNAEHNHVYYRSKQVEVRFLVQRTIMLVLTVISRFFN